MRVLTVGNMYPPHHLGGYELMWRSSVRHLRAADEDVRVLTTDYRNPAPDADLEEDPDVHRELRWYWRDHAWPRLGLRERLRLERHNLSVFQKHVAAFRPDVIAWWAMGGMSMSLITQACRLRLPAAAVVVDDWLLYAPQEDQWHRVARRAGPLMGLVERISGVPSRADFGEAVEWVFVSETVAQRARNAGWSLSHATVAHAGIDQGLFTEGEARPWRSELLYVGRIDPRKGVETAIRALLQLPGARLSIIGGGDEAHLGELRGLASDLGVEDRVNFGRRERDQLPAAYGEADAVLFPVTWDEPFGLVPLEAMAVGTPVIATGTGGSGEYLVDEHNCLLFPREDDAALAARVGRLAADLELRDRLRRGGLATAAALGEDSFNDAVRAALERARSR